LAESLVQSGGFDAALAAYEKLLADSPNYRHAKQALFRLGETAYLLKRRDAARRALERFQTEQPDDELMAYAAAYLGELALEDNDAARAQRIYSQALERFPEGAMANQCRYGLGRALEQQGDLAGARRFYSLLADNANHELADDAAFQLALMEYQNDRRADATRAFERFIETHGESPLAATALYWLGRCHLRDERWPEAVAAFGRAAEHAPEPTVAAAIAFYRAEALKAQGDTDGALAAYIAVGELPASDWSDDALEQAVRLATDAERWTDVVRIAADFGNRFPTSPALSRIQMLHGRALLRLNRSDEAIAVLKTLAKEAAAEPNTNATDDDARLDANSGDSHDRIAAAHALALAYLAAQQYGEARQVVDGLNLESLPADSREGLQLVRIQALVAEKQFAEAIEPIRQYLKDFADRPRAERLRRDLLVALIHCDRPEEAIELVREIAAAGAAETIADAALLLGDRLYGAEQFEAAVAIYQVALQGATASATDADAAADVASAMNDVRARALSGLGWASFQQSHWVAAADAFRDLYERHSQHRLAPEAGLMLARSLEHGGELPAALDAFDHVVRSFPEHEHAGDALFAAARLCEQTGKLREAVVLGERLINEHADFSQMDLALYQLAWDLSDSGEEDAADAVFLRLHRLHPASEYWADATFRLAERAARAEDRSIARRLLDQLLASDIAADIRCHALFLSGQVAVNDHRWSDVRTNMTRLLDEFADSDLRLPAEYWLAESLFRQGEFDEAKPRFDALAATTAEANENWMAMIPLRQAQLLARQKQWDEAFAVAATIPQRFQPVPQQYELDYVLGRCHLSRAEMNEARAAFDRVIRSPEGQATEVAAMAQWMTGETYFLQKRYDDAIRAYHRVEALYGYPRWQAAALVQAAKCYELKRQGEQAKRLYRQVVAQYQDTSFARQAAERLRSLEE
ncbi:MAG: tetratricopeptide repeat protein, partial [Planctomycetales bacterium]|nr:tetratricopeptide repeat protein [Planctomycetales bacterium]